MIHSLLNPQMQKCGFRGNADTEEPCIQRADCMLYVDFQLCRGSVPLTPMLSKGKLYIANSRVTTKKSKSQVYLIS